MSGSPGGQPDVVVVGAGLAGISAAHALHAAGLEVTVLEASERVGGRTRSRHLGDGALVEIGGAFLGPGHTRVKALAAELGLELMPSYRAGRNRLETEDGSVVEFEGALPASNPETATAVREAVAAIDAMAESVDLELPWAGPDAESLDRRSFAEWVLANVSEAEARAVLRLVCEAVLAVDPADVSLLHVLFYARASGGLGGLVAIEAGAQDERLVRGTAEISRAIAAQLGDRVRLGARVDRLQYGEDGVRVATEAEELRARAAVMAVPPAIAARLHFDPALPGERGAALGRFKPGSAMKCVLVYDQPFWREAGLSGHGRSLIGPAKGFFDVTPSAGRPGMILGFVEGAQATALGQRPIGERYRALRSTVERLLGPGVPAPRDYVDHDFSTYPHIGGCYAGYLAPGGWTSFRPALREPVGRLHWAGTETATEWYGYMEGAVRSGERAAREICAELG